MNGCQAEDVVTVGGDKLALMKKHLQFVANYYRDALTVKQVQDSIRLSSSIRSTYNIDTETVSDADLVVIMTARPVPYRKIAGKLLAVMGRRQRDPPAPPSSHAVTLCLTPDRLCAVPAARPALALHGGCLQLGAQGAGRCGAGRAFSDRVCSPHGAS